MADDSRRPVTAGSALRAAFQAVRRHRGMRSADVALAMNMPLRTYENFESGRVRLNADHLSRFGQATDCDPLGLVLSVCIDSPQFARHTADNKLSGLFVLALESFYRKHGDRIAHLDPRTIMKAFNDAFESLAKDAELRQVTLDRLTGKGKSDEI